MTGSHEINPYASPRGRIAKGTKAQAEGARIEGVCVVIRSGAELPMRCCTTNAECGLADQVIREFRYAPSFRLVIKRRNCRMIYYLCKSRREYFFWSRVLAVAILFLGLWFGFGLLAFVILLLILGTVSRDRLRVVKFSDGEFWIRGFNADFLDTLVTVDGWTRR